MIATLVFALMMLGTFKIFVESYRFADRARHRDNARSVLNAMADRFLRESIPSDPTLTTLWSPTTGPTGAGLSFTLFDGSVITATPATDPTNPNFFAMPLGDQEGSTVNAQFTRFVTNLDEATGLADSSLANNTRSGRLLSCQLTANFEVDNKFETLSIVVVRCTK
jgi:hypothetical protein